MKKTKKSVETCCQTDCCQSCSCHKGGHACSLYGLGVIGSLFYFIPQASGLGPSLLAVGKAFFWPALLIFRIFTDIQL